MEYLSIDDAFSLVAAHPMTTSQPDPLKELFRISGI